MQLKSRNYRQIGTYVVPWEEEIWIKSKKSWQRRRKQINELFSKYKESKMELSHPAWRGEKVFPVMQGGTGIGQNKTMRDGDEDLIFQPRPGPLSFLLSTHIAVTIELNSKKCSLYFFFIKKKNLRAKCTMRLVTQMIKFLTLIKL